MYYWLGKNNEMESWSLIGTVVIVQQIGISSSPTIPSAIYYSVDMYFV